MKIIIKEICIIFRAIVSIIVEVYMKQTFKSLKMSREKKRWHISTLYLYNFIQTTIHKWYILKYTLKLCKLLTIRAIVHDLSKYSNIEAIPFSKNVLKLKHTNFTTLEYQKLLDEIKPALDHHYKVNRHHPQYWGGKMESMSLIDKIEMTIDWMCAVKRTKNGNIYTSIKHNIDRFNLSNFDIELITKLIKDLS